IEDAVHAALLSDGVSVEATARSDQKRRVIDRAEIQGAQVDIEGARLIARGDIWTEVQIVLQPNEIPYLWTVPQACAWIANTDLDYVKSLSPQAVMSAFIADSEMRSGESNSDALIPDLWGARVPLKAELVKGTLKASGINPTSLLREEISSIDWIDA